MFLFSSSCVLIQVPYCLNDIIHLCSLQAVLVKCSSLNIRIIFLDPGPLGCYTLGLISAILRGDNNSIASTDKARGNEEGKP